MSFAFLPVPTEVGNRRCRIKRDTAIGGRKTNCFAFLPFPQSGTRHVREAHRREVEI